MKEKIIAAILFLLLFSANAQINKSIKPISESLTTQLLKPAPEIILPEFNLTKAEHADLIDAKNGELPKFSRSVFTDITLDNAGSWTELVNGDRLWRVQITSKGAQALLPYFNKFYLPLGSTFHVYSADKSEIIGAFTSVNNPLDGYYATGLIHGESCILEYYEPREAKGKGVISLNEIGHAYRWVNRYFPKSKAQNDSLGFGDSGNCEVNVNCSEGAAWQNQKRAVVCIIVQSSLGQGTCTGTLMNTVREDCTPYLLSAQHCSEGVSSNQYSQFLFYFNFESPNCNTPNAIGTMGDYFVSGCTKKSDSNDNGGDTGSDFLLLQLNNTPPDSFNVYYAGWNRINATSDSGVCIHHPGADIKKISTYTKTLVDSTWGNVSGTHWQVQWASTINGYGVTETGSSGSPIFNKQGQVVGQLTGGDSYCNFPNEPDLYGKFSYNWISNGVAADRQLQPWLDPDNAGTTSIGGRNADCVLGISETNKSEFFFELFPNPSSGIFNLRFSETEEKTISVFDVTGRIAEKISAQENNLNLNLSTQCNGVYILQIETKNGIVFRKLILNN